MSGIVLSASVRQNLLSLQSTADLLATTQNRLSTGKKVNTALDNPTNYFTAQGLDNRANDISNLLDGIGNGVQVLQAANTSLTFGASESLDQLNVALAANNLSASLDSANKLVITTTNDAASSTIGVVAYPGAGTGTLTFGAVAAPVADAASQIIRANLVSQYNNVITQITTTAQDSSFNGINLLNGDDLKLTFNETGKSTLTIKGVTFNAAGLGLAALVAGTDFLDSASAKATMAKITSASDALRTQASTLGSNLSIVQIRQDFSK